MLATACYLSSRVSVRDIVRFTVVLVSGYAHAFTVMGKILFRYKYKILAAGGGRNIEMHKYVCRHH